MISGSKGQKAVHACMIRLLNLESAFYDSRKQMERQFVCVKSSKPLDNG